MSKYFTKELQKIYYEVDHIMWGSSKASLWLKAYFCKEWDERIARGEKDPFEDIKYNPNPFAGLLKNDKN